MDPDQFHFGAHLDFGNFGRVLRLQPNFELGFGDGLTVGALNLDTNIRFAQRWDVWAPYIGGGVGLNFVGTDGLLDDASTDLGLNLIGGLERGLANGDRFFGELKLGLADSPDFKVTAGYTFVP